jgi:hypothetical protein
VDLNEIQRIFCARFRPREVDGVTILRLAGKMEPGDRDLFVAGVKAIIERGCRGFVCDLSEFDSEIEKSKDPLSFGVLIHCCVELWRLGGSVNWLHDGNWYPPTVMGLPRRFQIESEAVADVLNTLNTVHRATSDDR